MSTPPSLPTLKSTSGAKWARWGLCLQFVPLISIVDVTRKVWAVMSEAIEEAKASGGMISPQHVQNLILASVESSWWGTVVSLVGALLIFIAYFYHGYRPRWATVFIIAFGLLMLLWVALQLILG